MQQAMNGHLPAGPVAQERVQQIAAENDALRELVERIEEMARRTGGTDARTLPQGVHRLPAPVPNGHRGA